VCVSIPVDACVAASRLDSRVVWQCTDCVLLTRPGPHSPDRADSSYQPYDTDDWREGGIIAACDRQRGCLSSFLSCNRAASSVRPLPALTTPHRWAHLKTQVPHSQAGSQSVSQTDRWAWLAVWWLADLHCVVRHGTTNTERIERISVAERARERELELHGRTDTPCVVVVSVSACEMFVCACGCGPCGCVGPSLCAVHRLSLPRSHTLCLRACLAYSLSALIAWCHVLRRFSCG